MRGWIAGSASMFIILQFKDDPAALVNMLNDALPVDLMVRSIVAGSISLQLRARTVEALDELWRR
jgi:hypothetical protein